MLEAGLTPPRPKGTPVTASTLSRSPRPAAAAGSRRDGEYAALAAIGSGALLVVALWWRDTASVRGLGGWLTDAGRITGLLAGYSVVVLLATMARIPALERRLGSDVLARWHGAGGRYVVGLAVSPHRPDHLGLRRPGPRRTRRGDLDAAHRLPRRADGDGRARTAGPGRRHLGPRRPPPAALRDVAPAALLQLPRHRPGLQPPVRHRRGFPIEPGGARRVVGAVHLGRRPAAVVPVPGPGPLGVAPPDAGPGGPARERRRRLGDDHRARSRPAGGRARSVLPLAVPDPGTVVGGEPLLAVRRSPSRPAADHGQDRRRPQRRAAAGPARHPCPGRGPVRRVHRRAPATAEGAAGRRRGGHHATAGAVRVDPGRRR